MTSCVSSNELAYRYPGPTDWDAVQTHSQRTRMLGICYAAVVVVVWAAALVVGFKVALAVLVGLGFLSAAAGLRWRALGLIGVSTLCTLDNMARVHLMTGGLLRWNTFNYVLLIVMLVSVPLLLRRNDLHTRSLQAFLALLLVWLLVSPDWLRGASHTLNGMSMLGLLVYFSRASDDDDAWYGFALVNGLVAALGCAVYFMQRSGLGYMDRNSVSHFPLAAIFAAALAFRIAGRFRQGQVVLAVLAAINFSWVFLTTSRGGTMIASCCLLYMLSEMRGVGRRMLMVAVAGFVALGVMSYYPDLREKTIGRIEKLFDDSHSMTSRTSGRGDLALAGWQIFLEKPLGVGTGGFAETWAEFSLRKRGLGMEKGHGVEYACHNVWMKTLAENGIPAAIAFTVFVFSYAYVGWSSRDPAKLRLGLLVTVSLLAAFQVTEFQTKATWMLATGGAVLLHRRSLPVTSLPFVFVPSDRQSGIPRPQPTAPTV